MRRPVDVEVRRPGGERPRRRSTRRSSARTRATTSRIEKGLVT